VLIWRDVLLPPSETFIVNQTAAMIRWRPIFAGIKAVEGPQPILRSPVTTIDGPRKLPGARRMFARGLHPVISARAARCDLVHAHFVTDAVKVLPTARRMRKPLIVTAHGYDVTTAPELLGPAFNEHWAELVAYTSVFVAVSDFIAGQLTARGVPDSKIRHLPIGIPVTPAPAEGRREGVLYVGRLVEKKRPDHLVRAMSRDERLRATPLTIIGDGPLRQGLEARIGALALQGRFLGTQSPAVVRESMERAAVFCMPSLPAANGDAEGFGLVFLEAAAAGLASVAYDTAGANEAIADEETGLLARPGDLDDLAQKILRLLDAPHLARTLGAAGRQRVVSRFDVGSCTERLEDLYDEVSR
jgi:glycosyltransferase involved in cell wall biosynthesis